jgi:hypothetical protein
MPKLFNYILGLALVGLMSACQPTEPLGITPDPPILVLPEDSVTLGHHGGCPIPVTFVWRHGGLQSTGPNFFSPRQFLICVYRPGQQCEWAQLFERPQSTALGLPFTPDHIWARSVNQLSRQEIRTGSPTPVGADPVHLYSFEAPAIGVSFLKGVDPRLINVPDLKWTVGACVREQCALAEPRDISFDVRYGPAYCEM